MQEVGVEVEHGGVAVANMQDAIACKHAERGCLDTATIAQLLQLHPCRLGDSDDHALLSLAEPDLPRS